MANLGAEESIFGFQEQSTRENLKMAKSRAREDGRRDNKLSYKLEMIHQTVSMANFSRTQQSR